MMHSVCFSRKKKKSKKKNVLKNKMPYLKRWLKVYGPHRFVNVMFAVTSVTDILVLHKIYSNLFFTVLQGNNLK